MKKKILGIFICMLLMMAPVFTVAMPISLEKSSSNSNLQRDSTTLITEFLAGRIIEVNNAGSIVWQKTGLNGPKDAERLDNGNTLIADFGNNRVIEVDSAGSIVWEKTGLNSPEDIERLDNGNTLIADFGNNRVIEVDSAGSIVWEKTGLNGPVDAERLDNGNTLISLYWGDNIIEVDSAGNIVWLSGWLNTPVDVEKLINGNILIVELHGKRVTEFDGGSIVWQKTGLDGPYDAERLNNNNTLITDLYADLVIEVDITGNIVWQKTGLNNPCDAERIPNHPPDMPIINGTTSGKAGTAYNYDFTATDPDGDDVSYYIEWDDGDVTTWTSFQTSGTPYSESHTWSKGTYTLKAKAKDTDGAESEWATLEVTMPRNKPFIFNYPLLNWLFERFPNAFPILRHMLGI